MKRFLKTTLFLSVTAIILFAAVTGGGMMPDSVAQVPPPTTAPSSTQPKNSVSRPSGDPFAEEPEERSPSLPLSETQGITRQPGSQPKADWRDHADPLNPFGSSAPTASRPAAESNPNPRLKVNPIQQLNSDIQLVVNKLKKTDNPKIKEDGMNVLAKLAAQQFELYQKQRETELKKLEDQVKKLRDLQDRRENEKQKIIDERVRGLLRNAEGLGWEENATTQPRSSQLSR